MIPSFFQFVFIKGVTIPLLVDPNLDPELAKWLNILLLILIQGRNHNTHIVRHNSALYWIQIWIWN